MNLHKLLSARAAAGKPVRVGVVGCGKFATMFLAQALRIPGPVRSPWHGTSAVRRAGQRRTHMHA